MPKRDVGFFIVDTLISIARVKRYSCGITTEYELMKDEQVLDSIIRPLEILGEAVKHILQDKIISKYTRLGA